MVEKYLLANAGVSLLFIIVNPYAKDDVARTSELNLILNVEVPTVGTRFDITGVIYEVVPINLYPVVDFG